MPQKRYLTKFVSAIAEIVLILAFPLIGSAKPSQLFCSAMFAAQFERRPLVVQAKQADRHGYVEERGELLPYKPGDWLVTEEGASRTHVMSHVEFVAGYDPLSATPDITGVQRFRKKQLIVRAVQVLESTTIEERGVLLPVPVGDWIVLIDGREPFALSNQDFIRVYKPLS